MSDVLEMSSGVSGKARRWGMRLCLAGDENQARTVLRRALLDLGFEAVDALQLNRARNVTMCWSGMDGEAVAGDDPLARARREVLGRLDPSVHLWVARQNRAICQDEFLAQDAQTYTEFLQLPGAFGLAPWRTKVAVPYRGQSRGFSIGVASETPFEQLRDNLDDVRFLAFLYATLHAGQWLEAEDDQDKPEPALTPKQMECLRWAAAGKGYHDIAEILGISERTVRFHLNGARDQYGFATITQTIVQAAKAFDLDPLDAR